MINYHIFDSMVNQTRYTSLKFWDCFMIRFKLKDIKNGGKRRVWGCVLQRKKTKTIDGHYPLTRKGNEEKGINEKRMMDHKSQPIALYNTCTMILIILHN